MEWAELHYENLLKLRALTRVKDYARERKLTRQTSTVIALRRLVAVKQQCFARWRRNFLLR